MRGECEKCGEHASECECAKCSIDKAAETNKQRQYYYQGKFFEREEDFWAYVKEFTNRQTTVEDFDSLFDMLKKDVWMNLHMRDTKITNGELRSVLEDAFLHILERCWKRGE